MTIRFVFGCLPAFITWTEDVGSVFRVGYARWMLIKIRPKYKDDEGLIQHELEHVRQFYLSILPWNRMSHLERETEAYRLQLKYYPQDSLVEHERRLKLFASFLATGYDDFQLSQEEAESRLR